MGMGSVSKEANKDTEKAASQVYFDSLPIGMCFRHVAVWSPADVSVRRLRPFELYSLLNVCVEMPYPTTNQSLVGACGCVVFAKALGWCSLQYFPLQEGHSSALVPHKGNGNCVANLGMAWHGMNGMA
jgi:hypothetical protein